MTSTASHARATAPGSVTDPSTMIIPCCSSCWQFCLSAGVFLCAKTRTFSPRSAHASARRDPMKPVPPVIRTVGIKTSLRVIPLNFQLCRNSSDMVRANTQGVRAHAGIPRPGFHHWEVEIIRLRFAAFRMPSRTLRAVRSQLKNSARLSPASCSSARSWSSMRIITIFSARSDGFRGFAIKAASPTILGTPANVRCENWAAARHRLDESGYGNLVEWRQGKEVRPREQRR